MTLTPEQIEQGWKPHDGGPCPVEESALVEPLYLGPANPSLGTRIEWPCPAKKFAWWHDGQDDDIIAYREAQP